MITAIRRSFKSKIYKVVLWITFLAVGGVFSIFEFFRIFFSVGNKSEWVLDINGHKIYTPEFARVAADQEERIRIMRAQYGQYADLYFQMMGIKLDPQSLAANEIIRKELLNEQANKLPLYVSNDIAQSQLQNPIAISQELSDLVPFSTWDHSLNGVNPLALNRYLQHIGMTTTAFNHQLARAVKRADLKKLIEHSSYVPNFEIKSQFAQNFLKSKFSIATISGQDLLNTVKKEAVSDESLKAYYDLKNAQEQKYRVPEKRSARIATFEPANYGISVSDEEIANYYNNNKAQFIDQPAQVQVRRILFKVEDPSKEQEVKTLAQEVLAKATQNPKSFADLAKEYSKDDKTVAQGGLMPYFAKGQHDKTFERAAFILKDDGSISELIRTADGYEIVQRIGKKLQTFKPLATVSKDIKEIVLKKKFADQFTADTRKLSNQADNKEAVAQFIKEKNGKANEMTTTENNNMVLTRIIFKLKKGESSSFQENGAGKLVTLNDIKQSYVPELSEIKDRVKEDFYAQKAKEALEKQLNEAKNATRSFDSLGKVEKTGWLIHSQDSKDDQKELTELTKKGIDLGKMFQLENKGAITGYERNGNGYVIRLDERAPFDETLFKDKKELLLSQAKEQKKSFIMAGFVASLYRNAKINRNKSQFPIE